MEALIRTIKCTLNGGNTVAGYCPIVDEDSGYPILTITNQEDGNTAKQRVIGVRDHEYDVKTYKANVTYSKGNRGETIELSVIRDSFVVLPSNITPTTLMLSNLSFEPKTRSKNEYPAKFMKSYPQGHNTHALKLTQNGSEVIHAQARPDAVSFGHRSAEESAAGIMIHVGGYYGVNSISASLGCFGIVNVSNSPVNTSDDITIDIIGHIWEQAKKNKHKPKLVMVIIEKRDESLIPNNLIIPRA